jgi:hypothetical protein
MILFSELARTLVFLNVGANLAIQELLAETNNDWELFCFVF